MNIMYSKRIAQFSIGMALLASTASTAQNYDLSWHTIDGGGGTSTGAGFSLSGTIGQCDAGAMSGGSFSLVGGFWPAVAGSVCICPGDMNGDGLKNGRDVQQFVQCVVSPMDPCGCADMDGAGVTATDVQPFINGLLMSNDCM